jgi:DNA-binding transcriptional regulator YdaS (Cro superfamily)
MMNDIVMNETPSDQAVRLAIEKAGGISNLARAIGVDRRRVFEWKQIPAKRVLDVEKATGISRHILRPDIFGEENG